MTWKDINSPEQPVATDVPACCAPTERSPTAPIDEFIKHIAHVVTLGSKDALDASATLGRLLVLGLVTGCETYFRHAIVGVLNLCPLARDSAASHLVPLGAVEYYSVNDLPLALFDGKSLSNDREIFKLTRNYTGLDLPQGQGVNLLGEQYTKIGHLRHAAVHAHGNLTVGNVRAIGFSAAGKPHEVSITHAQLQAIAADCLSFVRAYNRLLYGQLIQRWVDRGVLTGHWRDDWRLARAAHSLFYSKEDQTAAANARSAYASFPHRPSATTTS